MITLEEIKKNIRNVENFPTQGVQFKDLTTILGSSIYLKYIKTCISDLYKNKGITKVVGLEARGFILAPAVAIDLNAGFIPIRKPNKLPYKTIEHRYKKEYGEDIIQMHQDAIQENDIVLIHDDVLATGGTINAAIELIKSCKVKQIYVNVIVELDYLHGREMINKGVNIDSLIHFLE